MSEKGGLIIRTYASDMLIPIAGSAVTVSRNNNGTDELIAFRITDENGKTDVIEIDTPDKSLSMTDGSNVKPFTSVNVTVKKTGYDITIINDVQIFSGMLSEQNVEMVPLPENAGFDEFKNIHNITPQNL